MIIKDPLRSFCDKCQKSKPKHEIAFIHFVDRTETGRIVEKKIIRTCRECFQKDLDRPIPKK